jgi:nucleoside-diphosphate-sugar epimerase
MTEQSGAMKVLVTGAYGLIGNLVYARLAENPQAYEAYGLARRPVPSARAASIHIHEIPSTRLRLADVTDFGAVQQAVQGMQVVVHLAANPDGRADWESVLSNNIIGAYHVFEACRLAAVKRVVYASTNQVVFGYRADDRYKPSFDKLFEGSASGMAHPIDHTLPPRPLSFYACSKVFGEALAHMYAYTYGLSCLCLRIGWVLPEDSVPHPRAQMLWCSQRDAVQLVERCINAPDSLLFDVFFGHSESRYSLVDIQHAKEVLGYVPQDRAEDHLAYRRSTP